MCVCPRPRIHSLCRDSELQLLFTPPPRPQQEGSRCNARLRVCPSFTRVCGREDERPPSYYIKQDFPRQSAPATEFPKPLPQGSRFGRKSAASVRARLFVLERHCSGDAEAMSQRRCPSLRPPATHCSIIKWLLLCHLASFPWWYLYSHVAVDGFYSTSLSFSV